MATSYRIAPGYDSGASTDVCMAERNETFLRLAREVADDPRRLVQEALAFGTPAWGDPGESIAEYAEAFHTRDDLTLQFDYDAEAEKPLVRMCASGGNPARALKEHLRRAYIRLLVAEMHRAGLEVNVYVG